MSLQKGAWITYASALTAVALWGLAFPLIQEGVDYFSPVLLGFLRFGLASALMIVVMLVRFPPSKIVETVRGEWKPLLVLGILYVTIPNIAQNIGLQEGTSSVASVIQSSGPIMTMIFAALLLKEELTKMKGLGTVIAMSGTILLVASAGISLDNESFVSNLLILISAISYGLAWVSAKRMLQRNPPTLIIGLSLLFGTALLAAAVPFETDSAAVFNTASIVNILTLGFLCAGVSSVAYLSSLEHEEVSRMAFTIYLMPVFASFFAWLLLDQKVESWTIVCAVIIILGIFVANRNGASRNGEDAAPRQPDKPA
ncbi:MAG: DMT family transporter [Thermoplasmata archaeon]|jgi:drug/metabolite transporter (DMT)-like permease|nr:DMT family transporter [Thermoplasmata archaeon]